jgi:hypothetical protein
MDGDIATADEYRERANKIRALAQQVTDHEMKRVLLRVAEDYESMAGSRERIAETDQSIAANSDRD